jgi:hypothetical protein
MFLRLVVYFEAAMSLGSPAGWCRGPASLLGRSPVLYAFAIAAAALSGRPGWTATVGPWEGPGTR